MGTRRYAAFLRGVSPMNAKMPELKAAFESAGFTEVKTVLSSGNVVFSAREASVQALERKAEAAMAKALGSSFVTFVRATDDLAAMVEADPFARFSLAPGAKRVVTFVRTPGPPGRDLPIEFDGATIFHVDGTEVFSAYVPSPKGPAFMALLERTFGKEITTRTWETVKKVLR